MCLSLLSVNCSAACLNETREVTRVETVIVNTLESKDYDFIFSFMFDRQGDIQWDKHWDQEGALKPYQDFIIIDCKIVF